MKRHTVFVDGQEGTTGLRIHEYLAKRDDVELLRIDVDKRKDHTERARLLNAADVAFLCLPDAAAREAAALVTNPATCLIDASTAHRVQPGWTYGLPELAADQRDALRQAKRISNPGCHATALVILVRPLVDAGLLPAALALSATSITGYSGGGKKMIEQYQADQAGTDSRLQSPRPYGLGLAHKHIAEVMAHGRLSARPIFMPMVASYYKGLAVTLPLHLAQLAGVSDAAQLHEAYARRYEGERFIRVMPINDAATLDDGFYDVQACNDSNRVDIHVFAAGGQAIVIARLDNLGKGASGAAVQCMNLQLGVAEELGL
jgi:N-acetyl-gamma-glutamyl-phosphate reductase